MRRMYSEVVIFCHGLKLEAPVVSSENYLSLPQKRISETAAATFIETQTEALVLDAKELSKTLRQVKRKVRKTIKDLGGGRPVNLPVLKKRVKQLGWNQKKVENRK